MSDIEDPGPPPELPEEYAAIYRDAYRRALEEEEAAAAAAALVPAQESRWFVDPEVEDASADDVRRPWLRPLGSAAVAVVVIGAAFGISRLVAHDDPAPPRVLTTPTTTPVVPMPTSHHPKHHPTAAPTVIGPVWQGTVTPAVVVSATATCTSLPAVDSANRPVTYSANNAVDGDPTTAWRCDGSAVGETLTFTLPAGTAIGEVGLIPGYAKTDPTSGIDRYAENNRITAVRWTLADGVVIDQRLDPSPTNRSPQTIRVPRTAVGRVTLEIRAVRHGPRDTTAISEVVLGAAP